MQVDLSLNDLGPEGAKAMAPAIRDSRSLNSVILEGKDDGCPLPVEQLKGTNPVASIDLSGKGLGVVSAIVIAELIKANDRGSLTQVHAFWPAMTLSTHLSHCSRCVP